MTLNEFGYICALFFLIIIGFNIGRLTVQLMVAFYYECGFFTKKITYFNVECTDITNNNDAVFKGVDNKNYDWIFTIPIDTVILKKCCTVTTESGEEIKFEDIKDLDKLKGMKFSKIIVEVDNFIRTTDIEKFTDNNKDV